MVRRIPATCVLGVALLAVVALSGCYEHGADRETVDRSVDTIHLEESLEDAAAPLQANEGGVSAEDVPATGENAAAGLPDQNVGTESLQCPFDLDDAELVERETKPNARSWTFTSSKGVPELVEEVLGQSKDRGYKLVEATTLDLEGNAWGCVVSDISAGSVYLITVSGEPEGEFYGADMSICTVIKLGG